MIIRIKEWICKCYIKDIKKCNIEKQHWENKYNNLIKDYSDMNYDYGLKIKELKSDIKSKSNIIIDLQSQLSDYTKDDKHLTLETFMDWLSDNVVEKDRRHLINADVYNWIIRNSAVRPSRYLNRCVSEEDEPEVLRFAKQVLGRRQHSNEDELVREFRLAFDRRYPTRTWYKTDMKLFGYPEYWATPMQIINLIKTQRTFGDCDDVSHLIYWCLKLLLNEFYPNWNKKRLRCFLVWVMGGYYHAKLAWVKEGVNDWIPIETTYMASRFSEIWDNNMRLRTNEIGYKINFSYDTEAEYEKI